MPHIAGEKTVWYVKQLAVFNCLSTKMFAVNRNSLYSWQNVMLSNVKNEKGWDKCWHSQDSSITFGVEINNWV